MTRYLVHEGSPAGGRELQLFSIPEDALRKRDQLRERFEGLPRRFDVIDQHIVDLDVPGTMAWCERCNRAAAIEDPGGESLCGECEVLVAELEARISKPCPDCGSAMVTDRSSTYCVVCAPALAEARL